MNSTTKALCYKASCVSSVPFGMARCPEPCLIPLLLRVAQVAEILSVSEREVWDMLRRKELTPIKVPGRRMTRVAMEDVESLVARWRGQTP